MCDLMGISMKLVGKSEQRNKVFSPSSDMTHLQRPERAEDKQKVVKKDEESCCGKKCFVVSVVALFLFVTFVSLPAGAFLIIYGRRQELMAFQLGGALVVSIPIVTGIIFCLILCLRRKSRKLSLNNPSVQI